MMIIMMFLQAFFAHSLARPLEKKEDPRICIMRSIILRIAQYAVIFPNCRQAKKERPYMGGGNKRQNNGLKRLGLLLYMWPKEKETNDLFYAAI